MFNAGFSSFRAASSLTALVLNAFQLLHASMSMFTAVDLLFVVDLAVWAIWVKLPAPFYASKTFKLVSHCNKRIHFVGSLGGHNNDPPIFWPVDIKQQQLALLKSISAQKPESHQYKIDKLVPAAAETSLRPGLLKAPILEYCTPL